MSCPWNVNFEALSLSSGSQTTDKAEHRPRVSYELTKSPYGEINPVHIEDGSSLSISRKLPRLNDSKYLRQAVSDSISTDEDDFENNNYEMANPKIPSARIACEENSTSTDDEDPSPPCGPDLSSSLPWNEEAITYSNPKTLYSEVFHAFPHFQQQYNWDCGISCVAMCLDSAQRRILFTDLDYFRYNKVTGFGSSTWTIDLCYILAHLGVRHKMYTVSLGVDPNLGKESFYGSIIKLDGERVRRRFQDSEQYGIEVEECQLSMENVLKLLMTTGPLIVLVNANLLTCNQCSWKLARVCTKMCCVKYQGHFVLVIGYDLADGLIHYRNPGNSDRICIMSVEDFDSARSSFGTDYDIIAINNMEKVIKSPKSGDPKSSLHL